MSPCPHDAASGLAVSEVHGKGVKELISDRRLLEVRSACCFHAAHGRGHRLRDRLQDPAYFALLQAAPATRSATGATAARGAAAWLSMAVRLPHRGHELIVKAQLIVAPGGRGERPHPCIATAPARRDTVPAG
jgi:hypothetical protein